LHDGLVWSEFIEAWGQAVNFCIGDKFSRDFFGELLRNRVDWSVSIGEEYLDVWLFESLSSDDQLTLTGKLSEVWARFSDGI